MVAKLSNARQGALRGVVALIGLLTLVVVAWIAANYDEPTERRIMRCLMGSQSACFWFSFGNIDPSIRTETGQTLLHFALAGTDLPDVETTKVIRVAEQLLSAGVDIEATDNRGLTALHSAVVFDDPASVKFLLDHGASRDTVAGPGPLAGLSALALAEHLVAKGHGYQGRVIPLLADEAAR